MYLGSEKRPRIEVKRGYFDYLFEGIALLACIMSVVGVVYFWGGLPERIPTHYNLYGEVNGYGGKSTLFLLVGVQLFMFLLLFFVARIPHHFNYLVQITEENAERQYAIAVRMIRSLNGLICIFFCYLNYQTIANGMGLSVGMGTYSTVIFLIVLFGTIFYFITRSVSSK